MTRPRKPTKAELKRMDEADGIARKRRGIEAKITQWNAKLTALEEACPHYNSWYENKGNTGGWDYDDSYWREYECMDCGKRWHTEQDRKNDKLYPHTKEGFKSGGEWRPDRW